MRWIDPLASQTGGASVSILSYIIEFNAEGGLYSALPSISYGTNSYLHMSLTGGHTYSYKIKAVNKYGEALAFSDATEMLTGQAPEMVTAPTTQITDIYVVISWVAPFDNYLEISSYQVLLKVASGDFEELTDLCDGSDYSSMTEQFCTVPMNEFWGVRLNNNAGDLV